MQRYRRFWEQSFDRLDEYLHELQTKEKKHVRKQRARTRATPNTTDREIVATRVFDAPRDLVFKMWTDPEHVAKWWGPKGFTNTIYEMDVRPGGVWRFVMHGPHGVDYQNKIIYVEVVRPERIVYDHVSGPLFRMTAIFDEQGEKSKVTVRMLFESGTLRDKVPTEFGAVEGPQQTLEDSSITESAEEEFAVTRVFDAPRELVWKAFTESERLMHWWGPKGFAMRIAKLDLRPGGAFHYCMPGARSSGDVGQVCLPRNRRAGAARVRRVLFG